MNCEACGGTTEIKNGQSYHYKESGLPNVYLEDIEIRVCNAKKCGVGIPRIPRVLELHRTIGRAVALKETPLTGAEIQYLRKHARLKAREFAKLLQVTENTFSKWVH